MTPDEVKKRKACNTCTKAKAKCLPFGDRTDLCQRCERLHKECVYQDSMRRRAPRQRGRMRQLEQRVESLVTMLATARNQVPEESSSHNHVASATATTSSDIPSVDSDSTHLERPQDLVDTPPESPEEFDALAPYDPVAAGLIDEAQANASLQWYRESFVPQFPFVVIDSSLDANTLRFQQPFLFLSIMAATSSSNPAKQRMLAEEFKDQVASRVLGYNHKSLEILQGLLIHVAYYNYFYMPGKQQMAIMLQLCIAIIQELGQPKHLKAQHESRTPRISLAEQRARLGTYYVAAWFSHAWRKRTTMPYTRSLGRLCQSIAEHPEHATDTLIPPLINITELLCQVNDYFSYDETVDSDIRGDAALELSTNNFRRELQRLRESMPENVRQDTTLNLLCGAVEVWIHECSLHSVLWHASSSDKPTRMSSIRIRMLQRSFSAAQAFLRDFVAAPSKLMHEYSFPVWSCWFYSTLVIVKLNFLHANSGTGALEIGNVPHKVGELLPRKASGSAVRDITNLTASLSAASIRDSDMAAREAEVLPLFQSIVEKISSVAPPAVGTDTSLLSKCALLQQGLIAGLKRRMESQPPTQPSALPPQAPPIYDPYPSGGIMVSSSAAIAPPMPMNQAHFPHTQEQPLQYGNPQYPYLQPENPPNHYFDNTVLPHFPQAPQDPLDTWMWDLVMDDVNMFTM